MAALSLAYVNSLRSLTYPNHIQKRCCKAAIVAIMLYSPYVLGFTAMAPFMAGIWRAAKVAIEGVIASLKNIVW